MVFVKKFASGAVDLYANALAAAAEALAVQDVDSAHERLKPISGELWQGTVKATRTVAQELPGIRPRAVSDEVRAQVLLRDGFRCSYCGGRGLPRCVMVGISDVFPDMFAYDAHYRRGCIHPAYWVLTLEADHTVPHAKGGPGDVANLTAMHALCNTIKSYADPHELVVAKRLEERSGWNGLIARYPGIVLTGNDHGKRHSSPGYHGRWIRRFGLIPLGE
jgi:hypothetical protein